MDDKLIQDYEWYTYPTYFPSNWSLEKRYANLAEVRYKNMQLLRERYLIAVSDLVNKDPEKG